MVKSGTIRLRVNPGVSRIFQTNTFFPNFHLWRFADLPLTIQTRPLLLRTGRLSIVLENLFVLQTSGLESSVPMKSYKISTRSKRDAIMQELRRTMCWRARKNWSWSTSLPRTPTSSGSTTASRRARQQSKSAWNTSASHCLAN